VLVDGDVFTDPSVCEGLHSFRETLEHARPVESESPTLIITGEFDPQTHRSNGPTVQRSLKNANWPMSRAPLTAGHSTGSVRARWARDFLNAPFQSGI